MGAFGYARRVIITPAVYPGLFELHHLDIQSTGHRNALGRNDIAPTPSHRGGYRV